MKDTLEIERKLNSTYDEYGDDSNPNPVAISKRNALGWVLGESDPITDDEEYTGKPATEKGIKEAIEKIRQEKETLPEYSLFGDPNWKIADAQIRILQWVLE